MIIKKFRRFALGVLTLTMIVAVLLVHKPLSSASDPYILGSEKYLFLDNFMLDTIQNTEIKVNPPITKELVLIADKPWEANGITAYCNVFWDPYYNEYRLYYVPICYDDPNVFNLCLATSTDGIHWEKPNLGAVSWKGSANNNIVIQRQREGTVMIDPNAPLERRYAYLTSGDSMTRLYTSSDGIHWTMDSTMIFNYHVDCQISSFWDDQLQKFVHYPRKIRGYGPTDPEEMKTVPRAVGRVVTDSMNQPWPHTVINTYETSYPQVMYRDEQDPKWMDIYTNAAQKYALAKSAYIAFPTPYYHYDDPIDVDPTFDREYLSSSGYNDGVIETQLATSRDGINWTRYRVPYVPLQKYEDLDIKIAMVFPGIIYTDHHLYQYFAGYTFTHSQPGARENLQGRELGGIFRLEQRIDGFTSMDFDYTGGTVITEPFIFNGDKLALNVNTSASGEGKVAILDEFGQEIQGFTLDECRIINGDYIEKIVTWGIDNPRSDVSSLKGTPICLKFSFRGAKLYSFRFLNPLPDEISTQNFDSDPSWDSYGNRTSPQNFGFSNTNYCGSGIGELGGMYSRNSISWYGDNTISGLSMNTPLYMEGKINVKNDINGGNLLLGWFNTGDSINMTWPHRNFMGLQTDGKATSSDLYIYYGTSDGTYKQVGPIYSCPEGTPYSFEFTYDPRGTDEDGIITVYINGDTANPKTCTVPLTHKNIGAQYTHFGTCSIYIAGGTQQQEVYVDSLKYTHHN